MSSERGSGPPADNFSSRHILGLIGEDLNPITRLDHSPIWTLMFPRKPLQHLISSPFIPHEDGCKLVGT